MPNRFPRRTPCRPSGGIFVRLDVFLKQSRLIKRRSVAQEACDRGLVLLNGRPGKPASQVKAGDIIVLNLGSRQLVVEVVSVEAPRDTKQAGSMYRSVTVGPASDN